jgi:guanyl-specific ribonuclease Sa
MKKILLCLFLFTSLSFYAQVANEVHCAGGTTFNLTNHNSLLIGNLNPAETTVSYHLTAADASNGVNAIPNPTNFIVPQNQSNLLASQTIYARINHLGSISTNYFSLIVNPVFLVASRIQPIDCYHYGTIMLDVFGGQAPFTSNINNTYYSTSDGSTPNFLYLPTDNMSTIIFSNLVAGDYHIQMTDAIGCFNNVSSTIEPSSIIPLNTPTATVINATCKGSNNGTININATGGKAPLQYSLDNGVNYIPSSTFTNLAAGNYTVYVKDASNCINVTTVSVTEPNLLQMSAAITKTIDCISNATVTLTATGGTAPYTYSKDGITFVQSNVFDNLIAGTYTTYVKDTKGCINQNSTVITPLVSLNTTITKTDVLCKGSNNGAITINATGGKAPFNYSIDNEVTYVANNTFTDLSTGTYTVIVKDDLNCTTSVTTTISEPILLSLTTALTKPLDCISNAIVTLTTIGGTAPYTYSKDGITFVQSNVFDNLIAGTYSTYVKDVNSCINQNSTVITPLVSLNATITKTDVLCKGSNNGAITINATGGKAPFNYSIDNEVTYVANNTFTNLAAGNYTVYVKDASNCINVTTVSVTEPNFLQMSAAIIKTIDCISNATVTLTATGGTAPYTYSKDGITFVQSNVFDNLVAGSYTFYVKDVNSCINSSNSITISPLPLLSISSTVVNINCKGEASGSITANATDGLAPYSYSLDNGPYINGNSSMTFTNLYAGTHNITVKDTNGCLTTNPFIISEPVSALMTVTTVKNQTITINATGGAGNYRYAISPNLDKFSTNNIFSGLTPGSYILNTSDVNGCYIMMNAVVDPPAPLINGQIKFTLEFKPGQTLADLIINGQNIKWYINQNPLAGKTSKTSEVPLPLSTVIVDGTTYYASQTINGIESTERLAVTVKSATLGTTDLVIKDFTYYPNPVKNIFTISNTSIIDEVSLISIKGETLLTKKINSLHYEFDLSNFSKGVYFLKVKAEGKEKTVKLIKE